MNSIKNLFPGFSWDLVKNIYDVSSRSVFEPGEILLYPGQNIRSVLLIRTGKIKLYREDQNGNEYFLFYLFPGQICAGTILPDFLALPNIITGKAVEKTEVLMIPLASAQLWMLKYKCWSDFVVRTFQFHISQLMHVLDLKVFKTMDERLEHYLETQLKTQTSPRLQISHREIANDMSSSREVISRLLKKMEQRGKIKLHRSEIEVIQ